MNIIPLLKVKKKSFLKNSFWSYLSFIFEIVVVLLTIPIYIQNLGIEQFGIYALLVAITAPLKVLRAGIPEATTKYVAEFVSKGQYEKCINIISTTLLLNCVIGIIGILLAFVSSNWIALNVFNIPSDLRSEASLAFKLTAILWLLNEIGNTYRGAVRGFQDYQYISIVRTLKISLQAVGGIILVRHYPNLSYLIILNCIISSFLVYFWYRIVKTILPSLKLSIRADKFSIEKTINFSLWLVVQSIFSITAAIADRLIIGIYFTSSLLGVYSVALKIYQKAYESSTVIINILLPTISGVTKIRGEAEKMILYYTWRITVICGSFIASLIILGPSMLTLWVGNEISASAAPLLRVLLFTSLIEIPSMIIVQYLYANALPKWVTIINIVTSILTIILMLIFSNKYSLLGIVWGGFIAIFVTRVPFHLFWVFPRKFKSDYTFKYYFLCLYGAIFSVCIGSWIGIICHEFMINILGSIKGLYVSIILSPIIGIIFIILTEVFIFRNKVKVVDLIMNLRELGLRLINKKRV